MIIKNTSNLDKEEAYKFLYEVSKKTYFRKLIFPTILFFMALFIIVLATVNKEMNNYLNIGYIFMACSLGFYIFTLYQIARLDKYIIKKNPEITTYGMISEFTFKEESFNVKTKSGDLVVKYEANYKDIYKIIRKDNYILFNIDRATIIIAKNEGFKNQKELELFFYGLSKHKTKIKNK